jgi:F-type H+-transporting ATPase subunit delta
MAEKTPLQSRIKSVLEDPRAESIARTYCDALLNAVSAENLAGTLDEFGSFIEDVLKRNPEFTELLASGMVSREDKIALIDKAIGRFATPMFLNFLKVLAQHDRLILLGEILRQCRVQFEIRQGRQRVQIRSARPLSDVAQKKIHDRLAAVLPFDPILETQTDSALLGGLVIRVGDTVYDGSLRTRLRQLRTRLRDRSLYEIQSGRNRFSADGGD